MQKPRWSLLLLVQYFMIRCINFWPGCSRPTGAVLQLNQPPWTSALLADTQMSSPASGSSDVREQISLGRCRERLNTRRGECHCFGDLQEGFYVLSCSLAARHWCWIPVPRRLLFFCTIRSTPHTPKLRFLFFQGLYRCQSFYRSPLSFFLDYSRYILGSSKSSLLLSETIAQHKITGQKIILQLFWQQIIGLVIFNHASINMGFGRAVCASFYLFSDTVWSKPTPTHDIYSSSVRQP